MDKKVIIVGGALALLTLLLLRKMDKDKEAPETAVVEAEYELIEVSGEDNLQNADQGLIASAVNTVSGLLASAASTAPSTQIDISDLYPAEIQAIKSQCDAGYSRERIYYQHRLNARLTPAIIDEVIKQKCPLYEF